MNAIQTAARGVDGLFDRAARGLKALSLPFVRSASFLVMPRTKYNYAAQVGDGMASSVVVAVVGWISRNFTQAPFRIRELKLDGKKVEKEIVLPAETGAGAVLRLILNPNTFYPGLLLWRATLADYLSGGNAYWWKRRNASGRVVELWWIPSWLIEPKWPDDGSEYISHYEYNPNGIPIHIKPKDIIPFRDGLDPRNPRKGLSKLGALAREIFTDDEASNFSATLLANLGVPGVIISPKEVNSRNTEQDPEGIKSSFMEKFGGDKRGEPLVLTAPTDVQILSFSPKDMSLTDLRRVPEERVSGAYGVPAIVAGLGAGLDRSTFANFAEAREAGWEENVIPLHGDFAAVISFYLLPEFVPDTTKFECDFDPTDVRVLQEDQNKLWERLLKALAGGGISRRTFKEEVGQEADDKDDVYYIPTSVSVVNADEVPPPLEADKPPEPDPMALLAAANGNGNGAKPPQLTPGAPKVPPKTPVG